MGFKDASRILSCSMIYLAGYYGRLFWRSKRPKRTNGLFWYARVVAEGQHGLINMSWLSWNIKQEYTEGTQDIFWTCKHDIWTAKTQLELKLVMNVRSNKRHCCVCIAEENLRKVQDCCREGTSNIRCRKFWGTLCLFASFSSLIFSVAS